MSFSIDICRVCLQNGANTSIFTSNGSEQFYIQIMSCASIEITVDDGLPTALCDNCVINLNTSYNFKHLCESSDLRLRNILSEQLIIKDVSDVVDDEQRLVLNQYILKNEKNVQSDINLDFEDLNVIKLSFNDENINKIDSSETFKQDITKDYDKHESEIKLRRTNKAKRKRIKVRKQELDDIITCDMCNESFKDQCLLIEHKQTCHIDSSQLTCKECHKEFKNKYTLNRHSKLHSGSALKPSKQKRHMCDLCGHTFYDRYGLNMHKRCHSGQRPFICSVCGHGFSQQSNMERHVKAKHEKVRPYQCNICSKMFAYSYVLTEHQKTHTGEKDFECGVCSRKFAKKFALNRHMLTHTLEKPFKCNLCEKAYTQSNDLNAHFRRNHLHHIKAESIEMQTHINSFPFMECNVLEDTNL